MGTEIAVVPGQWSLRGPKGLSAPDADTSAINNVLYLETPFQMLHWGPGVISNLISCNRTRNV